MSRPLPFAIPLLSFLFVLSILSLSGQAVAGPIPKTKTPGLDYPTRLVQDWAYQDYGLDCHLCFVDPKGAAIERKMMERVLTELDETERGKSVLPAFRTRLKELVDGSVPGADARWLALYRDACTERRKIRLETVVESAPEIVYTRHYVMGASFYAYTDDASDEDYRDFSYDRRDGGAVCKMTVRPDGTTVHETLYETKTGSVRDPEVSWDGKRVLFAMRRSFTEDDFHLYEYDIETKKLRQITFGPGFADYEPTYLPGGDILFTSTRCVQVTDCWWTEVANLYVCDAQGRFMRRVSFDQVSVNYPKVLPDGRVTYTRWDYNDRGQVFPQSLFVMNADATGQTEYYGNNSWFPTTILHARGIPDSNKVIAVASGHHTYQQGKLMIIDRAKGTQENRGITFVAPVRVPEAERIDGYGQTGDQFQYPWAFSENEFLVTYIPENRSRGERFVIPYSVYYMDAGGRRELLAWDPSISCNQQVPLAKRPVPPIRASQVDETLKTGRFYVHNVYEGPGLKGVPKGTIKELRVVALEYRAAGIRKNGNSGPGGGAMSCTPVSIDNGTWDVKKVLGHVPVEADGSAFFEVPAKTPVYFQLLDERGDVVQTMRSWSTLQPGEFFACVGCHEGKESTMVNLSTAASQALKHGARKPQPVWTPAPGRYRDAGFSYNRDIQPILDTHCVRCHTGEVKPDGTREPFSLLGNDIVWTPPKPSKPNEVPKAPNWITAGRRFSESYLNLTCYGNRGQDKYINWINVQYPPPMLPPYCEGAAKSPMMKLLRQPDANHRDVKLPDADLRKIALWIDLLVPYCGDYLEANDWTPQERARYAYYEMKRSVMESIVAKNLEMKRTRDTKGTPTPDFAAFEQFTQGGPKCKEKFLADYVARKLPVTNAATAGQNEYRNLALNPDDVQGEPVSWPHAESNSEYGYMASFAAKNAIDGKTENKGHGAKFPSWGPNKRTDLWLRIEFGRDVEIDKVVIWLRADFPHDETWSSGTLLFSDGSKEKITFRKTAEPQTFTFAKRRVNAVKLTDLKDSRPLHWCGVSELQVWGRDATP